MTLTDYNRRTMGDVRAHVEPVAEEVCERWPCAFVWGRSSGTSGEHPLGLALDFSVLAYGNGVDDPGPADPDKGDAIAAYLWEHRHRLNVWYVIWSRRIISTNPDSYAYNEWTPYDGWNPHTDHVHVSHESTGTYRPPQDTEGDLTMSDVSKLLERIDDRYEQLREYMARRTTARISDKNAKKYGYSKTVYQASSMAADASWRTRENQRRLADLSDAFLRGMRDLADLIGQGNAEQRQAADEIMAELETKCVELGTVAFDEPIEVELVETEEGNES